MIKRLMVTAALVMATAEAGAEARLVSYGDGGLKVGETSMYAKAVDGAAHDAAQELIWFRSAGTLYVIDLRDAAPKPVAIAQKMPEGAFGVSGVSKASFGGTYAGLYPVLKVGKSTKVTTGMGAYGGLWDEQDADAKKAIKKIKVVGKKWLAKQAKRVARAAPPAPVVGQMSGTLVKLPPEAACEGGGADCGDTAAFGDTPYRLLVVQSDCGDACRATCVFYDPKTKKFADVTAAKGAWSAKLPADAAGSCWAEDYGVLAGGRYFTGNLTCTVAAAGVACVAAEGLGPRRLGRVARRRTQPRREIRFAW